MCIDGISLAVLAILSIAFGILVCFWGYHIFRAVIGIVGFVLGAYFVGALAFQLSGGNLIITFVAGLIGGVIGAVLVGLVYYLGVFVVGALAALTLGSFIVTAAGLGMHVAISVILVIIGGVLALVFQKLIIIISTACIGAWGIIYGILYFMGGGFYSVSQLRCPAAMIHYGGMRFYLIFLVWIVLAVLGILSQYRSRRRKRSAPA